MRTYPLTPVQHTVSRLTSGAPVISDPSDPDATWYPGTLLTDPDGPTLPSLLKYVSDTWGGQPHVAAALAFKGYGYAAALPVVAGWLGHGVVPMLDTEALRVGLSHRLPYVRLDITGVRTVSAHPNAGLAREQPAPTQGADAAALADAARSSLLHGHLTEIVDALAVNTRPVAGLVEISVGCGAPSISRHTCCLWFASDTGKGQYCASCPVTL